MKKSKVMESWNEHGLYCSTWSPGDGVTRYRFTMNQGSDYFTDSGIYTALGWKEAMAFATGFIFAR